MDEHAIKRKLEILRHKSKKNNQAKVRFPWFMFVTSIFADLIGLINIIICLLTSGIWIAISETLWNILQVVIHALQYMWYKFFSNTNISPRAKNKVTEKLLVNKIIAILASNIPIIGDIIPTFTISTLVHYSYEKAISKLPIKI